SHCGRDQCEIRFGHLDEAESECRSPKRFVADERKAFEQWLDRCFVRSQIVDCAPEGDKAVAFVGLKDRAPAHTADGRERLQRCSVRMLNTGRVEREAVALPHSLERTCLAVIELREATGDGFVNV